ncbi:MAG: bifunctional metallophosphatase/5'-nucleotidase [Elusimicrobia bacterium]|nr:bifunctional metallophosphatase/5'-nucleotidase [Elusimicrobiota bacterium]
MRKLLTAALLFACLSPAWTLTISVYHTSDVHGWYSSRPAKWSKEDPNRLIGGFPALAALVKKEKNPWLLLDSGDMFQGTPEGNFTRGMATIALMNKLGYSAAVVGNHDYDYGEESLKAMISSAAFPVLGANVYLKESAQPAAYLKPYVILEKAGKKIAVLGLAGKHTATSTLPANVKHLTFRDESNEAAKWTAELKRQKPDAIIILTHLGIGGDTAGRITDISTWTFTAGEAARGTIGIARAANGAQAVFGGHNHAGLSGGWYDKESSTLILESFWSLTDVTKTDLEFDDAGGAFTGAKSELVPLWVDRTGEDQEVRDLIGGFTKEVDREMGVVVGESAFDLLKTPGLESDIGNWFTDAMRRQAGTDAAFQNSPGIRSDLRKGPVRVRDIYQVMPFENTLVKLTMTGGQLKRLLADNLSEGSSKLQVSGLRIGFRTPVKAPGNIVLEKDGKPVNDGDKLTVATNNYLTTGGTGGKVFGEAERSEDTLQTIRDLLLKDIKAHPVKTLPERGRIVLLK